MLSAEDNELLTRTGPGTPMGELFRRFWVPALLSRELPEPDCPPVRVTVLGEELLAFRDSDGKRRPRRAALPAPRRQPLSSAATRNAGCAASITAGSSTWPGTASTCRPRRATSIMTSARPSPHHRLSDAGMGRHGLGLYGPAGAHARTAARWSSPCCRPRTASSPRSCRSATGPRRARARSTPRISPSCTRNLVGARGAGGTRRHLRDPGGALDEGRPDAGVQRPSSTTPGCCWPRRAGPRATTSTGA